MQNTDVITIDQLLARAKRRGIAIMPILAEYFFNEDLTIQFREYSQAHLPEYNERVLEEALAEFSDYERMGLLSESFEEAYDLTNHDHSLLLMLQQFLSGLPQNNYRVLFQVVNRVLNNYNRITHAIASNTGTIMIEFADGEVGEFRVLNE